MLDVVGQIDVRHATFAQVAFDFVAVREAVESRAVISGMGLRWTVDGGLARFREGRAYTPTARIHSAWKIAHYQARYTPRVIAFLLP